MPRARTSDNLKAFITCMLLACDDCDESAQLDNNGGLTVAALSNSGVEQDMHSSLGCRRIDRSFIRTLFNGDTFVLNDLPIKIIHQRWRMHVSYHPRLRQQDAKLANYIVRLSLLAWTSCVWDARRFARSCCYTISTAHVA
jgi:hypothetical protein